MKNNQKEGPESDSGSWETRKCLYVSFIVNCNLFNSPNPSSYIVLTTGGKKGRGVPVAYLLGLLPNESHKFYLDTRVEEPLVKGQKEQKTKNLGIFGLQKFIS